MAESISKVKGQLDSIIGKGRVDLYKPIQIAEVLNKSRHGTKIDFDDLESFRNVSRHWRDDVTMRLSHKKSTSSARYQDDIWNESAMPPQSLAVLDQENKNTDGLVERYIYFHYGDVQETVSEIMDVIRTATPESFQLASLLELFTKEKGVARSIDKAYEIVSYSLFETVVVGLNAMTTVVIPKNSAEMLQEFQELASVLLGIQDGESKWESPAHIFRVGVTNAADRGIDMWANFGPAVQVKHISLTNADAEQIVDQVESDHIVVVCRDVDANVISVITRQIGWGQRVRGIVTESDLIKWYEKCLRGNHASLLSKPLLTALWDGFSDEFPQVAELSKFLQERGYTQMKPNALWRVTTDQ